MENRITIDFLIMFCVLHCFITYSLESAKREYFERNFAWHAIAQTRTDLSVAVDNATVMFIRPAPDSKSKDRLGIMKTTYNLKVAMMKYYINNQNLLINMIFH